MLDNLEGDQQTHQSARKLGTLSNYITSQFCDDKFAKVFLLSLTSNLFSLLLLRSYLMYVNNVRFIL